ncbi:hypothetical protein [Ralstonia syzygii]|uniref:hypothetical protein n=1 Tax=Ralstonia syzygii TaxID=28097 RepID=UPI0018D06E20|nr:hypothetical protein [Ralstonia syzygii]
MRRAKMPVPPTGMCCAGKGIVLSLRLKRNKIEISKNLHGFAVSTPLESAAKAQPWPQG